MTGTDLKSRILAHIAESSGLTTREIAALMDMSVERIGPRVSELRREKAIAPSPYRRQTAQKGYWRETVWLAPQIK